MIHKNKNGTIHGTYKTKQVTLKVLMKNDVTQAENIKSRIETFRETDTGVLTLPLEGCVLKFEKDAGTCEISMIKKLTVPIGHLNGIEDMLTEMCAAADKTAVHMPAVSSATNLLTENGLEQ